MTGNTRIRGFNPGWYYLLPEVAAPLGGGLLKLGQASTWAAVSVGLAPYVILAILYGTFVIVGYVPAVICYLFFGASGQDAGDRLIMTSTCAIVALLTLTPPASASGRTRQSGKSGTQASTPGALRRCIRLPPSPALGTGIRRRAAMVAAKNGRPRMGRWGRADSRSAARARTRVRPLLDIDTGHDLMI